MFLSRSSTVSIPLGVSVPHNCDDMIGFLLAIYIFVGIDRYWLL